MFLLGASAAARNAAPSVPIDAFDKFNPVTRELNRHRCEV